MYTNSITQSSSHVLNTQSTSATPAKPTEIWETEPATQTTDQDTYIPSSEKEESIGNYKIDIDTVNQMKTELEEVKLRFLETVKKIIGNQISYGQGAWKNITPEDQAAAQEAISEDGYWGVKQTSERIVAFGKALVGGDPSRMEEMRDAFIKGYEASAKAWSGALPEISQQTYDAVMKLFDEWAGIPSEDDAGGEAEDDPNPQPEVSEEIVETEAAEEEPAAQSGVSGRVGINAAKLARMLTAAKTRSQVQTVIAKIKADLKECDAGKEQGMDVDEASVKAAEHLLQEAKSRLGSAEDREATSEEEMASSLASLM